MDPAASEHNQATLPSAAARGGKIKQWVAHTSNAFVAEYAVFLIMLGLALSNLTWLIYTFFNLIVGQMTGNSGSVSIKLFVLWLVVSSLIALPAALVLWRRTRGELAENASLKGELQGGAKGFRTFWLVVSVLGMVGMLMLAIFVPLASLVNMAGYTEAFLGVAAPSLLGFGVMGLGLYIVTRPAGRPGKSKILLLGVASLTVLLFIVNFIWGMNVEKTLKTKPPVYTSPYTQPSPMYDSYYENGY